MLKIYLARHGQNEDNANGILNGHRDFPLTQLGESQAVEVARKIKASGLHFDYILTSPLCRASKTAEIIAEICTFNAPIVEERLIERDFGSMTGVDQSRVEELCAPDILKTDTVTYFLCPDGAEIFPDLLERAVELLDTLRSTHKDGSILLVTHGDIGKMIYAAYYNMDWKSVLEQFHFGNSDVLELSAKSSSAQSHVFKVKQYNT